MKILFPYLARWSSAHASRYYHLLTAVAGLGHDVHVLQPPSRGSGEANDIDVVLREHERVHVTTVSISPSFWNRHFPLEKVIKKIYFTFRSRALVKRICKENGIELLYLYNVPQFIYLFGRHPRVVFDFADDLLAMLKAELSISESHPVYRLTAWCLRWIVRRADFVICISGPLFNKVDHPRKLIIPNGAAPVINDQAGPHPVRVGNAMHIGFVGAFEYSMALRQVIDAAANMPEKRFVMVGAGRDLPRIQALVKEKGLTNVVLTGALAHDEAMHVVSAMDVCLNLFHKTDVSHAVSPLKLFEYLARKKPVISTRLHEVERINQDFLFWGDDVDEIVRSIRYIETHPEIAREKAERGFRVVTERFSWDIIARDFLALVS